MRAKDFLKEEDAIRWKPWDSEGRAWAVSPESWESRAADKINNFLFDKWLALKQTLGIEVTPEEIADWKKRNIPPIQKIVKDENGEWQWNPEWRGADGETGPESALRTRAEFDKKTKERLASLVPAEDNDEQDYGSPDPNGSTDRPVRRTGSRPGRTGRTSRLGNDVDKE
jgi:hypothetical protein